MGTELTPNGIKFANIEKEQTKAFLTVDSIGPDATGNIPLNLTSITDALDDLEQRLIDLQNNNSTATYTLVATPDPTNPIGEGTVFTITLNTTNVFNGEEIPYTITTDGVSLTDDFNSPVASSGYFKVENNTASWQVTIKSDELTEPSSESFTLTLLAGDNPSVTVNINDTSTTVINVNGYAWNFFSAEPMYYLGPNYPGNYAIEGDEVNLWVTVSDLDLNDTVNWTLSQSGGFDFTTDTEYWTVTGHSTFIPTTSSTVSSYATVFESSGQEFAWLNYGTGGTIKYITVRFYIKNSLPESNTRYITFSARGKSLTFPVKDGPRT